MADKIGNKEDPPPGSVVGQEDDQVRVTDQLLSERSQLQVVPIVGMAAIGKTTLAKRIYEDPQIERHFNARAWVTLSLDYPVGDIFLKLLGSMGQNIDVSESMNNEQLAMCLHRNLFNNRYLIVIDDMWDTRIWDEVKNFFPDNKNGSRILVTTRKGEIADYVKSYGV